MPVLELLDRLYRLHHAVRTNQGWALVEGKGKRPFVPRTTLVTLATRYKRT